MQQKLFVFFDVDSTVISIETLDYLVSDSIADQNPAEKKRIEKEIHAITDKGMNGEIGLRESILGRIHAGKIHKKHIQNLCENIAQFITPGIEECIEFLQKNGHAVFLLSSGFQEYLLPLAEKLHIPHDHVFGNHFVYDAHGKVINTDQTNPLMDAEGKTKVITAYKKQKKKKGFFIMVGDGINDLHTKAIVDYCIGFGAHKIREKVQHGADQFVTNSQDLLKIFHALVRQEKN